MNGLATAVPLTTRIAVHVLGVDPDRRVLLDRARPPSDLESLVEDGLHVVHLVFECGAEPSRLRTDGTSSALWWSLPEIVGLSLSARTRKALASRWAMIWPDT